jgi:hypothetical protein
MLANDFAPNRSCSTTASPAGLLTGLVWSGLAMLYRAPLNVGNKWVEVTYIMITDAGRRALKATPASLWYIDRVAEEYRLTDRDPSIRTMSGLDQRSAIPQRKLEQMIRAYDFEPQCADCDASTIIPIEGHFSAYGTPDRPCVIPTACGSTR